MIECPNCYKKNDESEDYCECGYHFTKAYKNENSSVIKQKNSNSNKETLKETKKETKVPIISFKCPVCGTLRAVNAPYNYDAFTCFECKSIFTYNMISSSKYDIRIIKKESIIPNEIKEACKLLNFDIKNLNIENLKQRYKEIQTKYHPDKVSHLGKEFQDLAEEKSKSINQAYELLVKLIGQ